VKIRIKWYFINLHDALINKNGNGFWKCWNSKFECHHKCNEVEDSVDVDLIAQKFADHFSTANSANDASRASSLYDELVNSRVNYSGFPLTSSKPFDTEVEGNTIDNLSRGKVAGLDGLTSENLQNCHPIISTTLAQLFNLKYNVNMCQLDFVIAILYGYRK
jgi:hypothetical protein